VNILGIDVGKKFSTFAILRENKVVKTGILEGDVGAVRGLTHKYKINYAGIDAPLSFPKNSTLRESERRLLKMGIKLFPSGAGFFREIVEEGIKLSRWLKESDVAVFEVYPYATRKILKIAPKSKKSTKKGLHEIKIELKDYIDFDLSIEDHNIVDAIISAFSVKLFIEGRGELLEGEIVIPKV
jgi:hypothetical protein